MKALTAVLVAVGCFYLLWCGAMALRSYWHLSDVVDAAIEQSGRGGPVLVRDAILKGAAQWEVPIDADNVVVGEDERGFAVHLRWTWPVITWRGAEVLQIPLSMDRSYRRP